VDRPRLVSSAPHPPVPSGARRVAPPGEGVSTLPRYDEQVSHLAPGHDPSLRDYEPVHPRSGLADLARRLWAPIAVLAGLLVKFKVLALAIFKLKLFATSGTMLVSTAAYAWIWGWRFAVGFVLLLLVHELGHVLELRRQGIPASAPLFIPFMGAVVGMKQMPHDAWREARVALAGPIVGSLGAAAVWAAGEALDSQLLVALAFTGFFLNLFNLLPIVPLDGGRAVSALHPAFWALGLAGLVILAVLAPNPILIVILVLGGLELWNRARQWRDPAARAYYAVTTRHRVIVGVTYIGLAALLALAMSVTHVERTF
jgi:Zn-dependent protease